MMKMYVIYDTLYEEYQLPFFMKNDNIARIEFETFVRSMVEKAPENEKAKTAQRFHMYFYMVDFDRDTATLTIVPDRQHDSVSYQVDAQPLPIIAGGESDV